MKWPACLCAALAMALPALATAASYEARIISGESASLVMRDWCKDHAYGRLTAQRVAKASRTPAPAVRWALNPSADEAIGYRRVNLGCGGAVLSRADNWYLPDRLTDRMNRQLASTETPFGLVVAPLGFTRRTVSSVRPHGHSHALQVRAVLVTRSGAPFSYVVETYGPELSESDGH